MKGMFETVKLLSLDFLIYKRASELLGIYGDYDEYDMFRLYKDDEPLEWNECEQYEFENEVTLHTGEKVSAISIYGDGTLEFTNPETQESLCWDEYDTESLEEILKALENITNK